MRINRLALRAKAETHGVGARGAVCPAEGQGGGLARVPWTVTGRQPLWLLSVPCPLLPAFGELLEGTAAPLPLGLGLI